MLGFSAISSGPISYSGDSPAPGDATAAGVILTGISSFIPGGATGGVSAVAAGAVWIGTSSFIPGLARDGEWVISTSMKYTIAAQARKYTIAARNRNYTVN